MILCDLHVHTNYSDGKNSPEEVVKSAIEKGMTCLGFSDHSYTFFDEVYCMTKADTENYYDEISALKEKYKDKIKILCGIEQDIFATEPTDRYDYVIGSVHYIKIEDEYVPVDETPQKLTDAADKYFGGDIYKLTEIYFDTVAQVIEKTDADIIGHFDLISKFNEGGKMFDESDCRYVSVWKNAVDRLIPSGKPFEINTGAISRGYRTDPYPSREMAEYIRDKGGKFILSSDSHSADTLCFVFDRAGSIAEEIEIINR